MDSYESQNRIVIDPRICHGKPTIHGTRTPVAVILGHIAGGDSFENIQMQYDITAEDIRACIGFANDELSRLSFTPTVVGR